MKLLLNIEVINSTLTGVGLYSREVISRLLESTDLSEAVFFLGPREISVANAKDVLSGSTYNPAKPSILQKPIRLVRKFAPSILWHLSNFLFWWRSRKYADYVYLELNNVARPFRGSTFLVCYDLSHIHFPEFHPAERIKYFKMFFEKSLGKATRIATISNAIREELESMYQIKNCLVAPPACTIRRASIEALDELELPERYILSFGSLEPRKNLDILIDAYMALRESTRKKFPLVIAGASGWKNQELTSRIDALAKQGDVIKLGYVNEGHVTQLYKNAEVLAYLSTYEGFGMPVIEAMAAGTPVLINDEPALKEAAGGAAEIVDATRVNEVTAKLENMLSDGNSRDRLIELGRKNASRFSWEDTTAIIYSGLKELAKQY